MSSNAIGTTLHDEMEVYQRQVTRLQVDVKTLQAENRRLRSKQMTDNGTAGSILNRAVADAHTLVGWRFANYSISRRLARGYGMSERRWMWAIGLLRYAGIIEWPGSVDLFKLDDLQECLTAIDRTRRKCEVNGLGPLVFRMARGRVLTPKR